MTRIFVDADGCPVKEEVYRVARRHGLEVILAANTRIRVPDGGGVRMVVVEGDFDAADDWIVSQAAPEDVVVTADIPLASRALEKGARVVGPKGRIFTADSIGDAMATRALMSHLRDMGNITGGPAPFCPKDRSRFLQSLEEVIQAARRAAR